MRKILLICLFFIFILTGCSNEAYNNAIQKGLDYIASEEYQKAEGAFELALEEKKQDIKATALLEQTRNYQAAVKALEDAKLKIATEKAEKVSKETEGSDALIKKAEEILASVRDLQAKQNELTERYELALQQFEAEEYENANKTINELLNTDLNHSLLQPVKKDSEKLQKDIETAILAKEKAEQEKAAKEEAERAAAEKAKEEEIETATVNLTADEALRLIKNLSDWPSSTTFESDTPEWAKGKYYGIYVDTHLDESNASRVYYLVGVNDGKIYDFSRGELAPIN